jgi:hypothetical protein
VIKNHDSSSTFVINKPTDYNRNKNNMALTSEQQTELARLNQVFKPFENLLSVDDEQGELAVHKMMVDQFPMADMSREILDELADKRQEILAKASEKTQIKR